MSRPPLASLSCGDGIFCNGAEVCVDGACGEGEDTCCGEEICSGEAVCLQPPAPPPEDDSGGCGTAVFGSREGPARGQLAVVWMLYCVPLGYVWLRKRRIPRGNRTG